MVNFTDFGPALTIILYILISFAFFVGILLVVSQEAFNHFDKALQKEYGIKKRLLPKIEDMQINVIDLILVKYRFMAGLIIAVSAFILLLLYRI